MAKQGEGTRRPQENPTEHQSQWLLDFLDRNLRHFSKSVRDAIGITIALLLVTVVLHGTIAPTYVEGRLLVQSAENDPPSFGRSYRLIRGNENPVFVNDNAYWILPVRGFIPLSNEVLITDDSGSRVGTFTFHAPWPILSALKPSWYNVEVRPYLASGDASRVTVHWARAGFVTAIEHFAMSLNPTAVVYAQPAAPRWQLLRITAHLEGIGDIVCRDGNWCGTRGEGRRLEGFALGLTDHPGDIRLEYTCGTPGSSWMPEGQFCGTRGQSRALETFAVRLTGSDAGKYTVAYQAHVQERGDTPVIRNGEFTIRSPRIEAIRVWLERR
jgi:hypothetical protein